MESNDGRIEKEKRKGKVKIVFSHPYVVEPLSSLSTLSEEKKKRKRKGTKNVIKVIPFQWRKRGEEKGATEDISIGAR